MLCAATLAASTTPVFRDEITLFVCAIADATKLIVVVIAACVLVVTATVASALITVVKPAFVLAIHRALATN